MVCVLLVLSDRRKANTSSSDGRATDAATNKTKKHNNQLETYETAADVTGAVDSLDKNGRLASTKNANLSRDDGNDLLGTYAEASMFGGYSSVSPVQVSQEASNSKYPVYYNEMDKKRAARTAQLGAGKTAPGHGGSGEGENAGKGNGGVMQEDGLMYESANGIYVGDNALYANVRTQPSASPSPASPPAASGAGQTREPIFTSINDVTLIDNAIYNQ